MIVPGKPKYCMVWAMETDDSEVGKWILEMNDSWKGGKIQEVLDFINSKLPMKKL